MTVPNQSVRGPRRRRFSVEALEERSLLSGLTPPLPPYAEAVIELARTLGIPNSDEFGYGRASVHSSIDRVQILEISQADDEADTAREIAVEELPRSVVSVVSARFPGARILAAEMDSEDGELLFDVSAELGGVELNVTLTPEGEVIELQQSVSSAELPQAARDWIERTFPGASIGKVQRVTADDTVSYEVSFATLAQQPFEATIRVDDGGGPRGAAAAVAPIDRAVFSFSASLDGLDAAPFALAVGTDGKTGRSDDDRSAASDTDLLTEAAHAASAPFTSQSEPRTLQQDAADAVPQSDPVLTDEVSAAGSTPDTEQVYAAEVSRAGGANRQVASLSATLRPVVSIIAQAVPGTWLPKVAAALSDVFPLDMAAIERSLQEFLDEVDSLAEKMAPASETTRLTPRLLFAVLVLTGTERVITEMKRRKKEPVLAAAEGKSTWTWVLGLSSLSNSQER